ncbi:MAG: outer membrane beta-barrel protein [Agriterribacter sp.]
MNKKIAFAIALFFVLFGSIGLHAQGFRLNGYSAYSFDDRVSRYYSNSDYYEGTIKGGFRWGVGAEYSVNKSYGLELNYMRQDTKAPVSYYNLFERRTTFDVAINWITLAGVRYMQVNEIVAPYGGLMAGMAIFDIDNPNNQKSGSATKFAWGARLGTNLFFSRTVGIKLQADLMSAVQSVGGSVYFGTGGSGTAISSYSTMLQFTLGGGLVFRLQPLVAKQKADTDL